MFVLLAPPTAIICTGPDTHAARCVRRLTNALVVLQDYSNSWGRQRVTSQPGLGYLLQKKDGRRVAHDKTRPLPTMPAENDKG